jgi:hypothetical protein
VNLRAWPLGAIRRSNLAFQAVFLKVSARLWPALAQARFCASLRGTVTDPRGVSGATVTLTNTETNYYIRTLVRGNRFMSTMAGIYPR